MRWRGVRRVSLGAMGALAVALAVGRSDAAPSQSRRPPPDDGLSCGGSLVLVGDTPNQVLTKCGQPIYADGYWDARGIHHYATWVYQRAGNFPRYVRFRDDVVVSIEAGTRF